MTFRPLAAALAAAALASTAVGLAAPAHAAACSKPGQHDINGDGFADTVVTEYGGNRLAGRIHVVYGSASGLVTRATGGVPGDKLVSQNSAGVPSSSEAMDEWGAALAMGDFDGDGCADVAVGAPGEDGATGAVTILRGTPAGLTTTGARLLKQGYAGLGGTAEPNDRFGSALVAADFDGDGRADLAVGAPGESIGRAYQAGAASVVYGAAAGLGKGRASRLLYQGISGLGSAPEEDDAFGAALAAGDFDGDGRTDLAVGVPGENYGNGAVHVLLSTPDGVGRGSSPAVNRRTKAIPGEPGHGQAFGAALAAGDLDGDGEADLAVGVPGDSSGAGAVCVLYGSPGTQGADGRLTGRGPTGARADAWTQDTPGVAGAAAAGDAFGAALATGRLDAGTADDLVIGAPGDTVGTVARAGSVTVLFGSSSGLTATGSKRLHQDSAGVDGIAAPGDRFGLSVAATRIMGGRIDLLVVGIPGEGTPGTNTQNSGGFLTFGRASTGPTATNSRLFRLGEDGLAGTPNPGTFLGYAFGA